METIRRDTGNKLVSFIAVDLSSQASVRAFAQAFLGSHSRLHVPVNNAGGFFAIRQESIDGIEMTLALNHVGPFPLTTLLLDALKAGAAAKLWALSESLLAARSAK